MKTSCLFPFISFIRQSKIFLFDFGENKENFFSEHIHEYILNIFLIFSLLIFNRDSHCSAT